MRLEINAELLILGLVLLITMWQLGSKFLAKKYSTIITLFVAAACMPALIPGYGEAILLLPGAALFTVNSSSAWIIIGLFFLLVNFLLLLFARLVFSMLKKRLPPLK